MSVSLSYDIIAHTHCVTEDTSVGSQFDEGEGKMSKVI
jgi:hypothetical protein